MEVGVEFGDFIVVARLEIGDVRSDEKDIGVRGVVQKLRRDFWFLFFIYLC